MLFPVVHVTVVTGCQPAIEIGRVLAQVYPADSQLLKAKVPGPFTDGEGRFPVLLRFGHSYNLAE